MSDATPQPNGPPIVPGPAAGRNDPAGSDPSRSEYVRGVRYGLSLMGVLLGVYVVMQWTPMALVSPGDPAWALQSIVQLLIGLLVLVGGFAVAPTSLWRALPVAVLVAVAVVVGAVLTYLRATGALRFGTIGFWILPNAGTAALTAGLLGWLIVRERPVLTYLLALAGFVPGIVLSGLVRAGAESVMVWYAELFLFLLIGVGGAWIGAGVAKVLQPGRSTPA